MLEIKNANKYFNKGKKNQVKAIDNTSITLEDNGLVALLGPSGCGKTTMLNAIGGLDKLKSGSIYINGEKINSKLTYRTDRIRNLNVGYIFQDYKLVDNLTVYDNVALVLKMIGLKDKKEIKRRVEYVLDKVGMLRYKRRPTAMLSGGERQRVAIARAIVKDPNIILADEPTGNLDSKNSLEVMKIIKAISKDRLVILVTHEQSLAKFYASRIIEIQDGKVIKDYENKENGELDYQIDNTFYLKDFDNITNFKNDNYDINVYTNNDKKIKLDIVVQNGNIYIKSNTKDTIGVVDEESSTEFINGHYKKIKTTDELDTKFNFDELKSNFKKKYTSILNPINLIINGFKKVFDYPILKKILLIGFFLSGMFLMYAVSSIAGTFKIEDKDFVTYNKNYLIITEKKNDLNKFMELESKEDINYVIPTDSNVNFNLLLNKYYQTNELTATLSGSLSDINMISEDDLLYGRMPTNEYEVVVDKLTIDRLFNNPPNTAKMAGIYNAEEMLNNILKVKNMKDFTIVGITNLETPCIYVDKSMFINILANSNDESGYAINNNYIEEGSVLDWKLFEDKIELKKGSLPLNDYEVIVNISNKDTMKLNKEIDVKVNGKKLKVVGYYDSKYNYNVYFTNNNTIKYKLVTTKENLTIYSNNKENTLNDLREQNINIKDSYDKSKNDYIKERKEDMSSWLLVAEIILVISLVEIFIMIRSSFLSRIKEIGIYRAIGVKRIDIYKMFFGEIIAITTIASLPGIIFMSYILKTLCSSEAFTMFSKYFVVNPLVFITTVVLVYVFNLIIGLIPIFNVIRKTPASILARHDLD